MKESCKHCDRCKVHKSEVHEESINKKEIVLYIISIIIFILTFIPVFEKYKIGLYVAVVLFSGYKMFYTGIKNIFKLNFEEDTLMTIAVIAAFILGEFPESCMVVLLYRFGEFLQDRAVEKSNRSIKNIVDVCAKTANVIVNEKEKVVDVEEVEVGRRILIKPGEMVPLDCKIVKGTSTLDTSSITGESNPLVVNENDSILSGSINISGALEAIVEKDYENSMSSQIVDLVYEATNNKGKTEEFITKFSKIYTPVVIVFAILIAIVPPLITGMEFKIWMMRALVFLVASCPCSIVISVPLAFFACIGAISKKGMIIKGSKHIENLALSKYIAFDKTGTVTNGQMEVDRLVSRGRYTEDEILKYMYALEKNSNHPISKAIKKQAEKENLEVIYEVDNIEEVIGLGLKASIDSKQILFGNYKFLKENNIDDIEEILEKNANYIVIDGVLEGYVTFKEEIRENIKNTIIKLKSSGIEKVIMLTGDNEENANRIAEKIGIGEVYSSLYPQDKLEKVKNYKEKGKVIFIGDGINDSPVLAEADFGISMGEGAEIANSAADAILISNDMIALPKAIKIAKKAIRIVKENIAFSLIVKMIVLGLGVAGIAPVWAAVVADTGVSLLTVLNCIRIYR